MNHSDLTPRMFRLHLWFAARWLPVGAKRRSIDRLLQRAMPPPDHTPYRGLSPDQILSAVREATARPRRMRARRCLREGLLGFRFLRMAGFAPVLHFGLDPASAEKERLHAHCWLTLDDACVLNPPTDAMVVLFSWDGERKIDGPTDA